MKHVLHKARALLIINSSPYYVSKSKLKIRFLSNVIFKLPKVALLINVLN